MKVRCKLFVNSITQFQAPKDCGSVRLSAVYESKPNDGRNTCEENHVFGQWTPQAEFNMTLLSPAAFAVFKQALETETPFYVDFELAPR